MIAAGRPDWMRHAACRGIDPDLFFPGRGESTREAKAVCAACPVRAECLAYVLNEPGPWAKFGVWGGSAERERRTLRRQRNAAIKGAA